MKDGKNVSKQTARNINIKHKGNMYKFVMGEAPLASRINCWKCYRSTVLYPPFFPEH